MIKFVSVTDRVVDFFSFLEKLPNCLTFTWFCFDSFDTLVEFDDEEDSFESLVEPDESD